MGLKSNGAQVRCALSLTVCAFLAVAYALRTDALYAITIWPAYVWLAPAALILVWRHRKRRGGLLWVPAAAWLAFVAMFAEEPRSILRGLLPATKPASGFRVVTLNCASMGAAAREVARWRPDLVLLQESPSDREVEQLATELFGKEGACLNGPDCAIVARGRLRELDDSTEELNHVTALWTPPNGRPIKVVSLRLTPPVFRVDYWDPACWRDYSEDRRNRRAELSDLWLTSAGGKEPLLMAGDFNTPPDPGTFAPLSPALTDCFAAAGRGWPGTAHNTWAFARIDQIWVGRGLRPVSAWAAKTVNSDHRMTVADVDIER